MDKKIISVVIITLIVAGGAGFYVGTKFVNNSSSKSANQNGQFGPGGQRGQGANAGANGQRGMMRNGVGFANGEILSADAKSLTIKNRDGGSRIAFIASSTQVSKFAPGTVGDLSVGEQVMINGTSNSDGSITASYIQIRPKDAPMTPDPDTRKARPD